MQIVIVNSAQEVAVRGAQYCCETLMLKPNCVFGFATGSSPIALYEELIKQYKNKKVSFKQVRSFNLDEYIGLAVGHPQSYRYFMNTHFFNHIDIDLTNTWVPFSGLQPSVTAKAYEEQIKKADGIDIQILGVGRNGHIGFNEPSSSLMSRTRVKTLADETIVDNSRFFAKDEFQPSLAITMGIGTILEAKKILLLATGKGKSIAVRDLIEGALCANCPASALQMHNDTTVIIDVEAASLLKNKKYYLKVKNETELLVLKEKDN